MESGLPTMYILFALVEAVAHLLVALVPLAIWQRTRLTGFLLLSASFAGSALMRLLSPWIYTLLAGGQVLMLAWRGLGLVLLALAGLGLWLVYGELRRHSPPPVAG